MGGSKQPGTPLWSPHSSSFFLSFPLQTRHSIHPSILSLSVSVSLLLALKGAGLLMENCGPSAVIGGAAVVGFLWGAGGVMDPVGGGGGGGQAG